jgi:hypothetical protein
MASMRLLQLSRHLDMKYVMATAADPRRSSTESLTLTSRAAMPLALSLVWLPMTASLPDPPSDLADLRVSYLGGLEQVVPRKLLRPAMCLYWPERGICGSSDRIASCASLLLTGCDWKRGSRTY